MTDTSSALMISAVTVGLIHTVLGVDHTVPFIALGRAHRWPMPRLLGFTLVCGLGHIAASIVLGGVGIAMGLSLNQLGLWETRRGQITSWLLIGFGITYTTWAFYRTLRNKPHTHPHLHNNGTFHAHIHSHTQEHIHFHDEPSPKSITAWTLFLLLVFGPCEPLIPLIMAAYTAGGWLTTLVIISAFGLATLVSMLLLVGLGAYGLSLTHLGSLERHTHILAGLVILITGFCVKYLT